MKQPQPKKHFQIQRLFGLAKPKAELAGMNTKEYLEELRGQITRGRTMSLSTLTFEEANFMIEVLGGTPFSLFTRSKRTENYRKQVAGIKTIETDAHLKKIEDLAAQLGWDADRLRGFCQRQVKKDSPATTEDGNKVLEGLKAMNRRDGLLAFKTSETSETAQTTASEPSFRRVA